MIVMCRILSKITKDITRPITCIIGGSKISTKINVIKNLISKFDNLIFVGGMANNILKNKKFQIGKSIFEENCDHIVEDIFDLSKKQNCKIIFPVDVSVSKKIDGKGDIKKINEVHKDDLILDIGPETLKIFAGPWGRELVGPIRACAAAQEATDLVILVERLKKQLHLELVH